MTPTTRVHLYRVCFRCQSAERSVRTAVKSCQSAEPSVHRAVKSCQSAEPSVRRAVSPQSCQELSVRRAVSPQSGQSTELSRVVSPQSRQSTELSVRRTAHRASAGMFASDGMAASCKVASDGAFELCGPCYGFGILLWVWDPDDPAVGLGS